MSDGTSQGDAKRLVVQVAIAVVGLSLAYFAVTVVASVRQRDGQRIAFDSARPQVLDMAEGETIEIYMDPSISGALQFDVYPSDFNCSASSPVPDSQATVVTIDQRRMVDGLNSAWSIAQITARTAGLHEIDCSQKSAPLLLVHPGPTQNKSLDWFIGVLAVVIAVLVTWPALFVVFLLRRSPRRHDRTSPLGLND